MRTVEGRASWVEVMAAGIRDVGCEYFRVHDSGDMFNAAYAQCWLEVCRTLPQVRFWIPTRAWQQPSGPLPLFDPLLEVLRQLAQLPNVTVRPSALNFGDSAPVVAGLHAGSTAEVADIARAYQCPAYTQGGHCGSCRVCWDAQELAVSYRRH
jgi:hypothetical protein